MLAQLKMELDNRSVNYRMSSNLQGVIYENIESDYVEEMHKSQLHPYSQCVINENGKVIWYVRTVTREAYEGIIVPLMSDRFRTIEMKEGQVKSNITKKILTTEDREELMKEFYQSGGGSYVDLEFQTATAFRQQGKNVIFPDLRLLYQSLMNKYSASSESIEMTDDETLGQLVENSEIVHYRLQSVKFPMEGISIPGFKGNIAIRLHGTDTMKRYVRLLCRFGEYSGAGMKTAMGMGAIRRVEWREQNGRTKN